VSRRCRDDEGAFDPKTTVTRDKLEKFDFKLRTLLLDSMVEKDKMLIRR
jgi:hypothetical protein